MAKRKLTHESRADAPPRCMLFNEHGGKVFTGEEAIDAALDAGYQDSPLDPDQLAQAPGDEAADLRAQNQDLNQALVEQNDKLTAASAEIADLTAKLAAETKRADIAAASHKKVAAALKKAQGNARK